MSEPMLTEKDIDGWRRFFRDMYGVSRSNLSELEELCTMALASIAMREVLKPFADEAGAYTQARDEGRFLSGIITIADLRRAAAAYTSLPEMKE